MIDYIINKIETAIGLVFGLGFAFLVCLVPGSIIANILESINHNIDVDNTTYVVTGILVGCIAIYYFRKWYLENFPECPHGINGGLADNRCS